MILSKGLASRHLLVLCLALCTFSSIYSQNDEITIKPIGKKKFSVSSIKGVIYTVILENSEKDGHYQLPSESDLYFKKARMNANSTLRIKFEKKYWIAAQSNLMHKFKSDEAWIKMMLGITDAEFKLFPGVSLSSDKKGANAINKQKVRIQKYITSEKKKTYYAKYREKIDYTLKWMDFFNALYTASNGEDNHLRHIFLPINILDHLAKNK